MPVRQTPRRALNAATIRDIIEKSVGLLERRCIPLNGHDPNWRGLFSGQLDDIGQAGSLPATKFDTIKMAVRFLVLHRDRSIRLVTEGLGSKPFHGRLVMLVNEHTLSAGEMVAAFAAENGLAKVVGTQTGGQVLGGANFNGGHGFVHLARRDRRRTRRDTGYRCASVVGRTSTRQRHPA